MKLVEMKNLILAVLVACFFHQGQVVCPEPKGGGVDTGNPKGQPTNDPTKPVKMEMRENQVEFLLPSYLMGGNRGGHELGPKIIKS